MKGFGFRSEDGLAIPNIYIIILTKKIHYFFLQVLYVKNVVLTMILLLALLNRP